MCIDTYADCLAWPTQQHSRPPTGSLHMQDVTPKTAPTSRGFSSARPPDLQEALQIRRKITFPGQHETHPIASSNLLVMCSISNAIRNVACKLAKPSWFTLTTNQQKKSYQTWQHLITTHIQPGTYSDILGRHGVASDPWHLVGVVPPFTWGSRARQWM